MNSNERHSQNASKRDVMRETFPSFSLPKRAVTMFVLLSRSIFHSLLGGANRFAGKELFFYDFIKRIFALGLNPKIEFDKNSSRVKILFQSGRLQDARIELRSDGSSDLLVAAQILLDEEYRPLIKLIEQRQPLGEVRFIVDAGANIGLTTVYLKRFFPSAKIVSIEPDDANFELLERNIESNNLRDVYPIKAGLWPDESKLIVDNSFRDRLEWSLTLQKKNGAAKNEVADVPGLPLSVIKNRFDFPRIDVLKIDIEGGERFLFADEAAAAETLLGVRYLALEIHDEFEIRPQIERFLIQNGFAFFEVGETVFAYRDRI